MIEIMIIYDNINKNSLSLEAYIVIYMRKHVFRMQESVKKKQKPVQNTEGSYIIQKNIKF